MVRLLRPLPIAVPVVGFSDGKLQLEVPHIRRTLTFKPRNAKQSDVLGQWGGGWFGDTVR